MEKENEKKRKLVGTIFAFLFGGLVLGILLAFSIDVPQAEEEPVEIIFDFSGGGKSGGSSEPAKTEDEKNTTSSAAEPIKTQEDESPVKKTNTTKTSTSKTKTTSSSTSNTHKTNDKALAGAGTFGNNKGKGSGANDGDGQGNGNGDGPGVGDNIGDGSGRTPLVKPEADNPTDEEGNVVVEILIDQSGKVTSAKVLSSHSQTTTSNPAHYAEAKKTAMKYKFSEKYNGPQYEKRTIKISFKIS